MGLRIAHRLVDRVMSSTPEGFRLPSRKVIFVGQGIDVALFGRPGDRGKERLQLITVGRMAPSKRLDLMLDAIDRWHGEGAEDWELDIIGAATSPAERIYQDRLASRVRSMRDGHRIHLRGRLGPDGIASFLSRADVFISMGGTGSLDKAIVEGMASRCIVLGSNDAFRRIAGVEGFPDCGVPADAEALAQALGRTARMSPEERRKLGEAMRAVAVRDHSLPRLIERVAAELRSLAAAPRERV